MFIHQFWLLLLVVCFSRPITSFQAPFGTRFLHRLHCTSTHPSEIKHASFAIADELVDWNEQTAESFVSKYWQKKPVLIRNFFSKKFPKIPTKEELLELSMDDDVESRILTKKGTEGKWIKEYGPFEKEYVEDFIVNDDNKSGDCWTILVQEVDRHIPAIADLWSSFDFIPAWRRDDIMISYASFGGGIGAHVDNYDVFLLQGRGRREWSIENSFLTREEEEAREVPNIETRLLRDFQADQTWTLRPGDVLYLPPRIPHRGTALDGGCTTVSFGYRAPSYRSMLTALTSHVCERSLPENYFYSDPDLADHGEQLNLPSSATVSLNAISRIKQTLKDQVLQVLNDESRFESWLGAYLTEPLRMRIRPPAPFFIEGGSGSDADSTDRDAFDLDDESPLSVTSSHAVASTDMYPSPENVIAQALEGSICLRRAEGVRMCHIGHSLFFNGEEFPLPISTNRPALIAAVSGIERLIDPAALREALTVSQDGSNSPAAVRFVSSLLRSGFFYPVPTTC